MPLDVDEAGRKVVAERRKLVAELTRVKNSEPTSSELLKNYKYGDPAEKIAGARGLTSATQDSPSSAATFLHRSNF